jgi:Uma2 family endonuclease
MNLVPAPATKLNLLYPESDGKPVADNTLQFRWIATIEGGLENLFLNDPNVFVAGDLLWYPVEGSPKIRTAPDALVVFGRPKGDRGSYMQWLEDNIPPQVVFEVLSPGNRFGAMLRKFRFYQRYGVEEYYLYNPDRPTLEGWTRSGRRLRAIANTNGWVSPRLGIRFDMSGDELRIFGPDGRPFASYVELAAQRDQERQEKEQARQRAERLAAQLRALGAEPEA